MSPFVGDTVSPFDNMSVNHESAATACPYDRSCTSSGPINGFGQSEAIGIICHAHRPTDRGFEILAEPAPVQRQRMDVAHESGPRRDRSGGADPGRSHGVCAQYAGFCLDRINQRADIANRRIISAGVEYPQPSKETALSIQCRRLDLRTTEVDTNLNYIRAYLRHHRVTPEIRWTRMRGVRRRYRKCLVLSSTTVALLLQLLLA